MSCNHAKSMFTAPNSHSRIYKEECTLCFDSYDAEDGVDICVSCYNGSCSQHSKHHYALLRHPIVLNISRKPVLKPKPERPLKVTKLAVGIDVQEYTYHHKLKCVPCALDLDPTMNNLQTTVDAIIKATSAQKQSQVKAWEEETVKPCLHLKSLVQVAPFKLASAGLAHCSKCDLNTNLWVCVTCGNLGCGRKQYGGGGGNGHGIEHFESTNHPISIKMGSISPEGTADTYCYIDGTEILDPDLKKHLHNFDINVETASKTEMSIAELQVEQNLKFDFSMTTEDGAEYIPVSGPGLTGLANIGNTCYLASVMQIIFDIPEIQQHYQNSVQIHTKSCKEQPASCYQCQMGKLASGLLDGKYSSTEISDGIPPTMFKSLIGKDHPEFSSMRQQDAGEFLQHVISTIERKERGTAFDPSSVFRFQNEQNVTCSKCNHVGRTATDSTSIFLPVPAVVLGKDDDGKPIYQSCKLSDSLNLHFSADTRQFTCPIDKCITNARFVQGFKTYPKYLFCIMSRFILGDNWVLQKLNVDIEVPDVISLDSYRAMEKLDNELALVESTSCPEIMFDESAMAQLLGMGFPEIRCKRALIKTGHSGGDAAMAWLFEHMDDADIDAPLDLSPAPTASIFDQQAIDSLMGMGFPEIRCKRALMKTGHSGADAAMTWLFEHMDDIDLDDPIVENDASDVDLTPFIDMGFTEAQAKKALKETDNEMSRAIDWLFSHPDSSQPEERQEETIDQSAANYELFAFISHRGTSVNCGHYVAFIKKQSGWVIFNDNKVAKVPDIKKHLPEGYIYAYRRIQE